MPIVKTQRGLKSLIPSSIKYLNNHKKSIIDQYHSLYCWQCDVLSYLLFYLIILSYCFNIFIPIFDPVFIATVYIFVCVILLCTCITMRLKYCVFYGSTTAEKVTQQSTFITWF